MTRTSILLIVMLFLLGCSSRGGDSVTLQKRSQAFLNRPIPQGMAYAPDSLSERFIREFAQSGKIGGDAESLDLLELCVMESENVVSQKSGEERQYFQESATTLREILANAKRSR